jgi:hypothetical protein
MLSRIATGYMCIQCKLQESKSHDPSLFIYSNTFNNSVMSVAWSGSEFGDHVIFNIKSILEQFTTLPVSIIACVDVVRAKSAANR